MRNQLRPLLAAALAMLFPGLGHLVLRRWGRALLWHLTIVAGGVALFAFYDVSMEGSIGAPAEAAEAAASLPTDIAVSIVLLYGLSAIDAYVVGRADAAARDRADATAEAIRRRAASADDGDESESDGARESRSPVAAVTGSDEGPTDVECPHCGKETDADLDFCHWCTEPLPWADEE
ncbi:DUF6677 family protein [Halorubrum pallidum]